MQKLYVIVRSDLSRSQQAVQAGHAVAAWCLEHEGWENGTLVYLQARGEWDLKWHFENANGLKSSFREPDRNNELTAVAILDQIGKYNELKLL